MTALRIMTIMYESGEVSEAYYIECLETLRNEKLEEVVRIQQILDELKE